MITSRIRNPLFLMALAVLSLCAAPVSAQTVVTGNVSGTWTVGGSPYLVQGGGVTVPSGQGLTIDGGVTVIFDPGTSITVNGFLRTQGDSLQVGPQVLMTSNGATPGDWQGVRIAANATADLDGLILEYADKGVWTPSGTATHVDMDGTLIQHCASDGVRLTASLIVLRDMQVDNCGGTGMTLTGTIPVTLTGISVTNCAGIAIDLPSNPGRIYGSLSGSGNGTNGIRVSGNLGGSEPDTTWTWEANVNFPVIINNMSINGADTLDVKENSVVKFWGAGSSLSAFSNGSLQTTGPGPVWFTSLADDSLGGDTNGDGAGSSPAPGDWLAVYFYADSVVDLVNTWFAYGGAGTQGNIYSPSGFISSVAWNGGGSIQSLNDGAYFAAGSITAQNLTFDENGSEGLRLNTTAPPVFDNITANNNGADAILLDANPGNIPATLSGAGNGTNGIRVSGNLGGTTPAATWTWDANTNFPVVIQNVNVNSGDVLEVHENAVVKFWVSGSSLSIFSGGTLRTPGSGEVWFTSLKDDSKGGDTNGDGGGSSPTPGDWLAVYFYGGSAVDLTNTWFAYGGFGTQGNIYSPSGVITSVAWDGGGSIQSLNDGAYFAAGSVTAQNLTFDDNGSEGLRLNSTAPPVLDNITANNNGADAILLDANPGNIPATLSG
ncbi:MAG: hypothetical protein HKN21_13020, partial [Candidatus Eisenbacteria bacterium]|nr:hypothetical protein [Candidatus Eisenbacteria bacterium]